MRYRPIAQLPLYKRVVSFALSFVLAGTLVPVQAFAHETAQSDQAAASQAAAQQDEVASARVEKSFVDAQTGIKLRVATSNQHLAQQLESAQLKVEQLHGAQHGNIVAVLGNTAKDKKVTAYRVQLLHDGQALSFSKDDEVTTWLPKQDSGSVVAIQDGSVRSVKQVVEGSFYKLTALNVSVFALVSAQAMVDTTESTPSDSSSTTPEEKTAAVTAADSDTTSATTDTATQPSSAPQNAQASKASSDGAAALVGAHSAADPSSLPLPASSAELPVGTYTVSANVSMMTPIGLHGFTTNPSNPEGIGGKMGIPGVPANYNATLVVDKDGARTLTVALVNPVFTVQNAESSEGVTVKNLVRVPIEKKIGDNEYNNKVAQAGVTTRVSHMTLELNNWSGAYQFKNWRVYATTLDKFFPNTSWAPAVNSKSLDLSVDLAHAKRQVDGDFNKTYTDEATGIEVSVKADKNSSVFTALQSATLKVTPMDSSYSQHGAAVQALQQHFTKKPEFKLYNITLVSNNEELVLDDKVSVEVSLQAPYKETSVYQYANGTVFNREATVSDTSKKTVFKAPNGLSMFALINMQTTAKYPFIKTITDPTSHATLTYATDGVAECALWGPDAKTPELGIKLLNFNWDYVQPRFVTTAPQSFMSKAVETAQASGVVNPTASGSYAMAFAFQAQSNEPPANIIDAQHGHYTFTAGKNPLSATVPVPSNHSSVYLVEGTVGKGAATATKLNATISNGFAQISLNDADVPVSNLNTLLFNAATGSGDGQGKPQTDATQIAYLVVVEPGNQKVAKPTAQTNLIYNGAVQTGVAEGEGYSLSAHTATDAGTYSTIATLKEGYVWEDGSKIPLNITWSIAKAPLKVRYVDEKIEEGAKPALEVAVEGFVAGQTAKTAKGYVAPTVLTSEVAPGRYKLTPQDGKADNYDFIYQAGTLEIVKKPVVPQKLEPGTYTITANLKMPGQYNPLIFGLSVYPNNPNNPFGPTIDENDPAEVQAGIPNTPLVNNATLVVEANGTKHLLLPIKNPIFTTQNLGTCLDLPAVQTERVKPTAAGGQFSGSYGSKPDRIHKMLAQLTDTKTTGTHTYIFKGSELYAVPLNKELKPSGDVALELTVDYSSLHKTSDSTTVPQLNGGTNPNPNPNPDPTPNTPNPVQPDKPAQPSEQPSKSGQVVAGTYTVSANIWVNKATSGLPLQPHFTNASFPPMNPVAHNATLRVDSNGHATVTVPIVIQSKIMQVRSLSGLPIVASSSTSNGLSSVTIDLGVLRSTSKTITMPCTASVRLGDLAATIIGGERERTWACTFQLNFAGLPSSGGGAIPEAARKLMAAQGSDGKATNSEAKAQEATDAALNDLDKKSAHPSGVSNKSHNNADATVTSAFSGVFKNPAMVLGGVAALAAVAFGIWLLVGARRKKNQ